MWNPVIAFAGRRAPRVAAAALVLLGGVPLAFGAQVAFGGGAAPIIHATLGLAFVLIACGASDFGLARWFDATAAVASAALAAVFLLQGASDLVASEPLRHLAFDVLGQRVEKLLGYTFLLWCAGLLVMRSSGASRWLGAVALVAVLGTEVHAWHLATIGQQAHGALKLLYLPLFVWLLVESTAARRSELDSRRQRNAWRHQACTTIARGIPKTH